ncbi:MAG TPA: ABC transporter permease subunit [Candidatus Saccharimonadaceae bacterium]|jgi:NitT/TauT family transport system permease protein|nr:ABC transporter permease subunit [Candidatus Saccharimonadaceae bacterium]
MAEARATSRWWPIALIACVLALATLAEGPKALSVARGVVRQPGFAELPAAAGWSLLRMTASYVLSLAFAWIVGYQAATNPRAARVILPLLDVGQSVPVLGFFPAAIFLFVTLLGGGRWGIEMASIFLLFTSQSWNLAFGVYEGLSTIPLETRAAAESLGVRGLLLWRSLLLPACIPTLIYNSILSWANGWYFLIASEIIVAGPVEYPLPGLGSMMSRAFAAGNLRLATGAIVALMVIVLVMEFALWRPLRAWSQRFRYDSQSPEAREEARFSLPDLGLPALIRPLRGLARAVWRRLPTRRANEWLTRGGAGARSLGRALRWPALAAAVLIAILGVVAVVRALRPPWPPEAASVPLALLFSFLRINAAYVLALLWTIPVTLWASDHPRGARALSLVAQVGASLPATAFFPVLVALLVDRFGGMEMISVALALTGMQWYLLFNLLAGAQRVPNDLRESLRSLGLTRGAIHRRLTLPACMPSLVTGSIVAWGGTWNALILSEYVAYRGKVYEVLGVGALLNRATFKTGNRTLLFLSLAALVITVVAFNRLVWDRLFRHVSARYRLEG